LLTENSSTIISALEIYKKVPQAIAMKIPGRIPEDPANIHPIAIPIGLADPNIKIIEYECFFSTFPLANEMPKVSASAHLCIKIAIVKLKVSFSVGYTPIAKPSKIPCKDNAMHRR
jgi:hypothetical protein